MCKPVDCLCCCETCSTTLFPFSTIFFWFFDTTRDGWINVETILITPSTHGNLFLRYSPFMYVSFFVSTPVMTYILTHLSEATNARAFGLTVSRLRKNCMHMRSMDPMICIYVAYTQSSYCIHKLARKCVCMIDLPVMYMHACAFAHRQTCCNANACAHSYHAHTHDHIHVEDNSYRVYCIPD